MFPAIKALLKASPELSALVADRIYPDSAPQDTPLPALSLFQVSAVYGDLVDDTPLITASNWQINCMANSRMEASLLADAVFQALHGKASAAIRLARVTSRNDELPDAGVRLRRTILDVAIKHFS